MTRTVTAALVLTFVAAAGLAAWHLSGVGNDLGIAALANPGKSYAGSQAAPEFPAGMDWINSGGEALSLGRLKGKVVLLDFWTYGCANCIHVIPDLARLEKKYARELVVIGVHSAKFPNEGRTSQIRKIVQRYELEHPVVNDQHMQVWNAYGVNAWPTLALVDPAGNAVGQVAGEGHYDLLDRIIGALVEEFRAKRLLDETPFAYRPDAQPNAALRFPGKVLADAAGGRLFISDSNHDRIIVAGLDGTVQRVIGGARGFADGAGFAVLDGAKRASPAARFHGPQGLALAGPDVLFVADTHNDAIRRVDLTTGLVATVAGTGAHGYMRGDEHAARDTPLNTPWDLAWVGDPKGGLLYVAMAGQHQLWRYDPRTQRIARFAGSGYEALEDGARLDAGMNQPSGLSSDGARLYVADSEASAVRVVDLAGEGRLTTLVGTGLFDFGDADGIGRAVRLQHALGVAWRADAAGGTVFIADTYNGKLKALHPRTRSVTTLAGGFDEPGGLSIAGGKVYLADTNHHAIEVYDLATRKVTALTLKGL